MDSNFATTKQRSDLTFRYNSNLGRHGWLRLTPAYSVKVVNQILDKADPGITVLDPFSGTGTTPLCAAYRRFPSVSIDINPFLVWLARAKTETYEEGEIKDTLEDANSILDVIASDRITKQTPPIHNIERWWPPTELAYLSNLKSTIDCCLPNPCKRRDLLLIAFCRLLIKLSNAAFNHQSMSFKEKKTRQLALLSEDLDFDKMFLNELNTVITSTRENPLVSSEANL